MSKKQTVVIEMSGGLINVVTSDGPVRVIILDSDTEGGDPENIVEINYDDVYVQDMQITNKLKGTGGNHSGIQPDYVKNIKRQLKAAK